MVQQAAAPIQFLKQQNANNVSLTHKILSFSLSLTQSHNTLTHSTHKTYSLAFSFSLSQSHNTQTLNAQGILFLSFSLSNVIAQYTHTRHSLSLFLSLSLNHTTHTHTHIHTHSHMKETHTHTLSLWLNMMKEANRLLLLSNCSRDLYFLSFSPGLFRLFKIVSVRQVIQIRKNAREQDQQLLSQGHLIVCYYSLNVTF